MASLSGWAVPQAGPAGRGSLAIAGWAAALPTIMVSWFPGADAIGLPATSPLTIGFDCAATAGPLAVAARGRIDLDRILPDPRHRPHLAIMSLDPIGRGHRRWTTALNAFTIGLPETKLFAPILRLTQEDRFIFEPERS